MERPSGDTSEIVYEYPQEYEAGKGMIAYYPVVNEENLALYEKYSAFLARFPHFHLLGRLGNYRYINMDAAVADALALADRLTADRED